VRGATLLVPSKPAVCHRSIEALLAIELDETSSHDAAPGAIATRDCASWRGKTRAVACASKEHSTEQRCERAYCLHETIVGVWIVSAPAAAARG
jgi:hypothetical protein